MLFGSGFEYHGPWHLRATLRASSAELKRFAWTCEPTGPTYPGLLN
jgi:hypothetical protein